MSYPINARCWFEVEADNSSVNLEDLSDSRTYPTDICIEFIDDIGEQSDRKFIARSKLAHVNTLRLRIRPE